MLLVEVVHARLIGHYRLLSEPRFAWVLIFVGLVWLTTYAAGVNETLVSTGTRLARSAGAVLGADVLVALIELLSRRPLIPLFTVGISTLVLIPALSLIGEASEHSRRQRSAQERVLAVLGAEEAARLEKEMGGPLEEPALLVGLVEPAAVLPREDDAAPLETLVDRLFATLVVLDREAQSLDDVVTQAARLHSSGTRIRTLSLFYDEWLGKLPISELERIALLFDINEIHRRIYARSKRVMDLAIAALGLVLLLAAAPLVALADLFGNRGSLFYRQPRVGKDGAVFTILKFRTMVPTSGESEWTSRGDPRITRVGAVLRRLHVDELPQVINVLRQDLSVVGPRPEQPGYVDVLSKRIPFYEQRHLVRPGMTGWAQVKYAYGASELDAMEKLQYEFYYLRHQSLLLDLRILGMTLRSVVGRRGM